MVYITLQEDTDAVRLDSLLDFKKNHFFTCPVIVKTSGSLATFRPIYYIMQL